MWFEGRFLSHVLVESVGKNASLPSLPSSFQQVDYVNATSRSKARLVGVMNQVLCAACHIRLVTTTELGYCHDGSCRSWCRNQLGTSQDVFESVDGEAH